MAKQEEPKTQNAASTTVQPEQHKLSKKERERQDEIRREANAKAHAKEHGKKHGNN